MKLYCFVILIFVSVIFTVGEERKWGNGGIRGVNSLPTSATNQNEAISNSYLQPLLARRSLNPENTKIDKKLSTDNPKEQEPKSSPKHPSPTTNLKPIDDSDKVKHGDSDGSAQDNNKNTAEKLEEEAQTIKKVIVVLCSLGASLLLVAIAIAILYWKVRRQQKELKNKEKNKPSKRSCRGGDTTGSIGSTGNTNDDDNNNNNGNVKRDNGGGVGDETSDSNRFAAPLITGEKIINNSDLLGVNNGVVCEVNDNIRYTLSNDIPQGRPPPVQPSAPSAEKLEDYDLDNDINGSNVSFSTPPLTAPPAYSPTAPPIYALPHSPIPEFDDSMEPYMNGSYQLQNSHNLETNSNVGSGTFIMSPLHPSVSLPPNNGVWYAAGPTSQTSTPINDTSNQQSGHSTIIHPSPTVSLNSSSNPHENNDDNNDDNKPSHQRHNSSTI